VDVRSTAFHAGDASPISFVTRKEARAILPAVFERHRAGQVGEIRRRDYRWDDDLGLVTFPWEKPWNGFVIVHRDGSGDPDGYARYTVDGKWEDRQPRGAIEVQELIAVGDRAYADLWRFLGQVDLVATVRAERRAVRERLPWLLTNQRAARVGEAGDGLFVLLLDAARALATRTYERSDHLVLDVVSPAAAPELGPGRLELDATSGGAACRPTRRSPDLTVPLAALGAACLGGVPLAWAADAYGGIDEHVRGSLARADRLFRTIGDPWCSTFF